MGKTDILIGKKATWGSDDDESEDDRPRRRAEAGEFSESGEDIPVVEAHAFVEVK